MSRSSLGKEAGKGLLGRGTRWAKARRWGSSCAVCRIIPRMIWRSGEKSVGRGGPHAEARWMPQDGGNVQIWQRKAGEERAWSPGDWWTDCAEVQAEAVKDGIGVVLRTQRRGLDWRIRGYTPSYARLSLHWWEPGLEAVIWGTFVTLDG